MAFTIDRYKQIVENVNLSALNNKSIFITGGTGFFGYWLLQLFTVLNNSGHSVKVTLLSRDPELFLQKNPGYENTSWLSWVKGDVTDYNFPDQSFDYVIHGAANTSPLVFEKPATVFTEIVLGTHHVLKHAFACGAKRVLMLSSGAVYGEVSNDTLLITEEHNTAPETNRTENAYGEAKRAIEMLAHSYSKEYNIEVVTARCFAFSGLGIGPHLILNILLKQALQENELVIKSSGRSRRSFLHGRDLAVWLLKILVNGNAGEIYNVGSDQAYTIKELAEIIKSSIAPEKKIIILGEGQKEQRLNYVPSVEKARLLGLDVWTSLQESIDESLLK